MDAVNHNELLTPTQAARLKGVSRQWITSLIRVGKLEAVQIAGRNFVRQRDVLAYKPAPKTGRPPKVTPDANKRATGQIRAKEGTSTRAKGGKK